MVHFGFLLLAGDHTIAHRLSTVTDAERIIVLDKGKIIEIVSHMKDKIQ